MLIFTQKTIYDYLWCIEKTVERGAKNREDKALIHRCCKYIMKAVKKGSY